jgi:hypothetical protein
LSAVLIAAALRERIARLHWRTMRAKSQSEQRIIPGKRSALTKPVCWQSGQVIARSGMVEGLASLEGRAKGCFGAEIRDWRCNSSGSLAMFTAIRRASSRVSSGARH